MTALLLGLLGCVLILMSIYAIIVYNRPGMKKPGWYEPIVLYITPFIGGALLAAPILALVGV